MSKVFVRITFEKNFDSIYSFYFLETSTQRKSKQLISAEDFNPGHICYYGRAEMKVSDHRYNILQNTLREQFSVISIKAVKA